MEEDLASHAAAAAWHGGGGGLPADPDDARDDYDDVVEDCASVATDSTRGYEKDAGRMTTGSSAPTVGRLLPERLCAAAHARNEDGPFLCTTGRSQTPIHIRIIHTQSTFKP